MKRRLLASILTLVMLLSLLPTAVLALDEAPTQGTPTEVSQEAQNGDQQQQKTEAEPQEQSKEISSAGGNLTTGSYVLNEDVELQTDLTVPEGAVVTLDLNGNTLRGTRSNSVIVVYGELTVKDSSGNNSGKITGGVGYASDGGNGGGAISIESGGKCTLEGGTLTGNHCDGYNYNAGGVYAKGTAEFYMTGGVITENTANRQGGGVFGGGSSTIVISGGEISNNTAQFGGGVCYNGKMTMTGGTIKNNTAQYSGEINGASWPNIMGGGIKVNSKTPLEFYGGEVSGNKAISSNGITALGAGIYGGDIKVMGDVKVCDNKRDDTAENVYLDGSAMLEVVGALSSSARLPVTRATQTGRVTSSNGFSFDGIIIADDTALKLETRKGDLYFTKTVDPDKVICTMQVEGNTLGYDSLSAALADLPSDDNVITLLKDIDLGAQVSVPANSRAATITAAVNEDGTPIVITWENATASFFNIPSGAALTVSGNIIIRGSNTKTASSLRAFDVAGTLNFGEENSGSEYPKVEQFDLTNDNGYAAIYVNGGTLNLYSGTLSQNEGYYGGAVSVRYNGNANLFGGTISGNTAPFGGGLYVANSTATISGTKISENSAKKGGGIYNQNGTVTIKQGEISRNWVDGEKPEENPNGGGIYSDGTVTMNGGKIIGNAIKVNVNAYGHGRGAAVCNKGKFTITAGTVSGNYCEQGASITNTTMYCAGLYNEKQMEIAGGTISGNYYKFSTVAKNSNCFAGVGVSNNGGTLTISGGTITGNGIQSGDSSVAGIAGAGVASTANSIYDAVFNMTGGTITGNNGGTGSGAGLYLDNSTSNTVTHTSTATISGGSIVGNTGASGVYAAKANLSISGNPVISGQKTNLYLGSNKITLSGALTNGAAIGVTANTPTDGNPVQITTAETGTEYYKDAARYFIPDAAKVIAQANDTGKYVELAYTTATYHKVTLNLIHASATGGLITQVKDGESYSAAVTADTGYTLPNERPEGLTGYDLNSNRTTASIAITSVSQDATITLKAVPNTYTVMFDANGGNGTMDTQRMTYDTSAPLTANAFTNAGYNFAGWSESKGGEVKYPDGTSVKNLTAENGGTVTLYAIWTKKTAIPKFDDGNNAIQSYKYDGNAKQYALTSELEEFIITYKQGKAEVAEPTDVGTYDVIISRAEDATYAAFSQTITSGLVITAADYPVTVQADKTSMTGSGTVKLSVSSSVVGIKVTGIICSDSGIVVAKNTDGTYSATLPNETKTYTFTAVVDGVSANYGNGPATCTVSVTRRSSSGGSSSSSGRSYAVSAPSAKNGDVTVSPKNASKGDRVTVTVKPDAGYVLGSLEVKDANGNTLSLTDKGNGKYTFTMPASKVEIKATFVKEVETSPFSDVSTSAYYYEAVKWAQEKGITGGIGNGLFGPNQPCTRAQIVTFLWRAAGSPEPKAMSSFADVSTDAYYAKAVAWAVENGITTGTGDGKFSSDATCTRAQSVTFLFRAIGKLVDSKAEFSDVLTDSYYANAVAWAVENGVTNGIGDGLFGPDNSCTRAQIVTFLFRAYQGK